MKRHPKLRHWIVGAVLILVSGLALNFIADHALAGSTMSPVGELREAAEQGKLPEVERLTKGGVDINVEFAFGETPLMIAAQKGHLDVVRYLVNNGANVNARDKRGKPCLLHSIGHPEILKFLIDKGADVNARDANGWTCLMHAFSNAQTVSILLGKGADVNAKNKGGGTALLEACAKGNPETVKMLLDRGADVNAKDNKDFTTLMATTGLSQSRPIPTTFGISSQGLGITNVRTGGPQQKVRDCRYLGDGQSHFPPRDSQPDLAGLLLARGADVKAQDSRGWTAWTYSTASWCDPADARQTDLLSLLLKNGATINEAENQYGTTALIRACILRHALLASFLVERGADLNAKDNRGVTALMSACNYGELETVRLLLDKGADVNAQAEKGITA